MTSVRMIHAASGYIKFTTAYTVACIYYVQSVLQ